MRYTLAVYDIEPRNVKGGREGGRGAWGSGLSPLCEALTWQAHVAVDRSLKDGLRIRGDIHICLMGDPGVAKSQVRQWSIAIVWLVSFGNSEWCVRCVAAHELR